MTAQSTSEGGGHRLGHVPREHLWPPGRAVTAARSGGSRRRWLPALLLTFWALAIYQGVSLAVGYWAVAQTDEHWFLIDGHAYWAAWRNGLYWAPPGHVDAYLYSPAFAQVLWPVTLLPFWGFAVIWWGAIVAAYAWLVRPLAWSWRLPLVVFLVPDLVLGNVYAFWALALVASMRFSGAWAFLLLTKVSPGIGLLWYVARRQWRALAVVAATTAAVVLVSALLDPTAWTNWVEFLLSERESTGENGVAHVSSLPLRLGLAAVIAVFAARLGHAWALPVVAVLASPLFAAAPLGVLAAVPRLIQASPGPVDVPRAALPSEPD